MSIGFDEYQQELIERDIQFENNYITKDEYLEVLELEKMQFSIGLTECNNRIKKVAEIKEIEYFLRLKADTFFNLDFESQVFLNYLGLEAKQLPSEADQDDKNLIEFNKEIAKAYDKRDEYLFNKRKK